jgi:transcriptional regulator with XRE-family HTH domain
MPGKFATAIKNLRESLGVTQLELAVKLDIGGHAVSHFEYGRKPDSLTTARLCRIAHEAGRDDLADIFVAALPGVKEGVVVPVWRLPNERQADKLAARTEAESSPRGNEKAASA